MSQLDSLPKTAVISGRSGQASATITKDSSGYIVITSTCDSLQREIYRLEEYITRIRNELQDSQMINVTSCTPTLIERFWIWCGKVLLIIVLLYLIYRAVFKRFLNGS